jgi:hypothetical protein
VKPIRYGYLGLALLPLAFGVTHRLSADEPTIETLVSGTPVLAPHNQRLTNFQLTFETSEFPFVGRFAWSRPDQRGMVFTAGDERTPFLFLSGKEAMLFDVTSSTALLTTNAGPQFVVRSGDDGRVKFGLSITSDAKTEIMLDLPAFFRQARKNGKLERDSSGHWRLTGLADLRNSEERRADDRKVIAVFGNSIGFPIRQVEVRSAADDSLVYAIRDISINEDAGYRWPRFPAADCFPRTIKLLQLSDFKTETVAGAMDVPRYLFRGIAAQAALRDPKLRGVPYLGDVDWAKAQRTHEQSSPPLRELFKIPWAEPKRAPEPAVGPVANGTSSSPAR